MIDRSFLDLFPKIDEKWLYACYGAAYENRSSEMVIRKGKKYHVTITPIGKSGFCSGLIQAWDKDRNPVRKYGRSALFYKYVSEIIFSFCRHMRYKVRLWKSSALSRRNPG